MIYDSIYQFRKNISIFKNYSLPELDNIALFKKKNKFESKSETANEVKFFLEDFDIIQEYRPNTENNFVEFYEFIRGLIHLYINSKKFFYKKIFRKLSSRIEYIHEYTN